MANAQEAGARWAQRMGASQDKWRAGVEGVTIAPGQLAARQADTWANNTIAAKPKWAANVASVSLQDWRDAMLTKGGPRIATGAAAAQGKFTDFMVFILPKIDQIKAGLPARGTFEQNLNRMTQFSQGMHAVSYKK